MSIFLDSKTHSARQARLAEKTPADSHLTTPAGVVVVRRGVIHYANDCVCRMLGHSKEELAGLNVRELFTDRDDSERLVREIHRQVREYGAGTAETQWRRKDGESITVQLSASLADPNGLDTCLSIVVAEISEPVGEPDAADEAATLLGEAHEVFLSGPVVVFKWCKGEGRPVGYVTPNVEDMLGYSADDFVSGRVRYLDIICEEDRKRVAEEVATNSAAAITTSFVHEPYRVTRKDGTVIWLADHTTICREPGGDITHYIGYVLDTSRTKQMEETLRQALTYGRQVISGIGQGVAVYDRDFAYLEWNPFMESLTGKSRDEMVGKRSLDVFPHLREWGMDKLMFRALAGETVTSPEIPFTNSQTGKKYWLTNTYSPNLDRFGEIVGVVGLILDVTDRMTAERALVETALLAKAIVHGSPIPQFIIDRDHKVTHWNAALEELTGIKAGDILGSDRHWKSFYSEERPTMADILVESTFDTIPTWYVGKYRKSETVTGAYEATDYFPHLGPSGKWLHFTASAILDSEGQIIGAVETLQDITERKRAEEELLLKNRAVESSVNAVMINDLDGKTLYVNDSFLRTFGYSHEEAMHLTAYDIAADSEVNDRVAGVMEREGSFLGESFAKRKDGSCFPVQISASTITDAEGRPIATIGSFIDITKRKLAEQALAASEERYRNFVLNTSEGIFRIDFTQPIDVSKPYEQLVEDVTAYAVVGEVNHAMAAMFGVKPEEMAGRPIREFDPACGIQTADLIMSPGCRVVDRVEEEINAKGETIYTIDSAFGTIEDGILKRVWGVQRDITEQRKAQQALKESEEKYRRMVDTAYEGIWVVATDSKTTFVNARMAEVLGYAPEELVGRRFTEFMFPEDVADHEQMMALRSQGIPGRYERRLRRKDGEEVWTLISGAPLYDAQQQYVGSFGMIVDMTERKRAEAALAKSEGMMRSMLEASSVGIALIVDRHMFEINASLCRITGYTEAELVGRNTRMLYPSDEEYLRIGRDLYGQMEREGLGVLEARLVGKDGRPIDVILSLSPFNPADMGAGVTATITDITERKRAEEAVRYERDRAQKYLDTVETIIVALDTEGKVTTINRKGCQLLGWTEDELVGRSWFATCLPQPDGTEAVYPVFLKMMEGSLDGVENFDNAVVTRSGETRAVSWHNALLRDEQGRVTGALSAGEDITERKRAEEEIQSAKAFLDMVIDMSPFAMWISDKDGTITRANRSLCETMNLSESAIVGRYNVLKDVNLEAQGVMPDVKAVFENHQLAHFIIPWKAARAGSADFDGARDMHIDVSMFPILDAQGELTNVVCQWLDITERKRAEEALRISELTYREIFNAVNDTIWIHDSETLQFLDVNRKVAEMFGYSVEEALNLSLEDISSGGPSFSRETAADLLKKAAAGDPQVFDWQCKHKDGHLFWSEVNLRRGTIAGRECILAIERDVTERKRAEDALRMSEANLTTFFDTIKDLLFVVDVDGRILRVNNTVTRRLGLGEQELVGADFATLTPPELRHETARMIDAMRSCDVGGNSLPILAIDGRQISVETKVVRGQWSGVPVLFIVSRDISELRASEEKFSKSFQMNAALMAISTLGEGRYVDVNDTFLHALGYSREEVIGRTSAELTMFADPTARDAVVHALGSHQQVRGTEVRITKKDGSLLTGLFAVDLIDIQGVPHLLTVMNDITERKRAEEKLLLNSRRVQALLGLNQMAHATLKEITSYALEEAVAITQSDIGYLAFVNDDESVLTMHSWSNQAMQRCAIIDKPLEYRVAETGLWGEAVRQRRAVITNDYGASNEHKKGCPSGHVEVRRHMNVPIFAGEHIVLVIGVGNKELEYGEADVEQLTLLMEGMWRLIERLNAQEALTRSEQRFRTLFENMQEGVALHEVVYNEEHQATDYRILDVNPAYERHTGINPEHARGRLATELYGVETPPYLERWVAVAETGEPDVSETYFEPMQKHFRISAVSPSRGSFATVFQDITLQKQQDAAIREREEKLSSIFRSAPIGIGMVKGERVIVEANDELCRMIGYSREEILGQSARVLYATQEEYERVGEEKHRQISASGTGTVETCWQRKDESSMRIVLSSSPLDPSDPAKGVTFTALDITDRIRAEEAVREKAEELDRYFTSAIDLLCIADTDGRFRRLNKEWEHVLGYPLSELEGTLFVDLVHPDDREAARICILQLSAQQEVSSFTNRYRCKDGSYRWIEWRSIPSGDLIYACARDITERTRFEQALVESEHRFRLVGEQTGQIVYDWDMATGNIKWIGSVERIIGFTADEYQQVDITKWEQMVHPDDRRAFTGALHEASIPGVPHPAEYRLQRKDGSYVYVEDNGVFLRNDRGEPYRMIGTMKDISERKKAQEDRERLIGELEGKNAELERFAYTVSHDLKAPLITISGFIGVLKQHVGAGAVDRMNSDMDRISNAANKMSGLLDSLLEVSRIGRIVNPSEAVSVTDLALEAAEMLAGHIGARGVEIRVPDGLPAVFGDRARLLEVLQNLIDNAVKYMGDQTEPRVEIDCEERGGETVFHVRDNGIGIQPRFHERVFDLFRQLDPSVDGSGVGLALVKRIVEYHGGRIWVESEGANQGSTFYFTLPGAPSQEQLTRSDSAAEAVPDHVG